MGTWGLGIFDNDAAADFASTVADGGGIDALQETIDRVLAAGDSYLEASDAQEALAAADIVARLRGSPGQTSAYSEDVDSWITSSGAVASDALARNAKQVIARVLAEPSELLEEWAGSEEFEGWKHAVDDLARRL